MKRSFDDFINTMIDCLADYKYYVDFDKVYKNVDKYKVELNILNSLIGSKNIEQEFRDLVLKYPDVLDCIPILLAVRSKEIFVKTDIKEYLYNFETKYNIDYFKEMYLSDIEKKWNVDLSNISANNVSTKRFDFVIKKDNCIYVIETNFYSSSGSKLNETARSYKMIALESKDIKGVKFIWITDGKGWKSALHNLEETYNVMDTLYNINDLDSGILENL